MNVRLNSLPGAEPTRPDATLTAPESPNYRFNCPYCGHPISIRWETPVAERDMTLMFALLCTAATGGCGALVSRLASEGWRLA
jgi:hypothetical protein